MQIETPLAEEIIHKLKNIIPQEINYIATSGEIIASTDSSRVGTIHEGAKLVIKTNDVLIVEYDNQYFGTKKGINVPINIDKRVVAVIGITGDKKKGEQYIKIIKHMTEILVKENWLKTIKFNKRNNYKLLIDELMMKNPDEGNIETLAKILNVNLSKSYFFILGEFEIRNNDLNEITESIINILHPIINKNSNSFYTIIGKKISIVYNSDNLSNVQKFMEYLFKYLKDILNAEYSFGIGTVANSIESLNKSYINAKIALEWGGNVSRKNLLFYDNLDLGLLIDPLSHTNNINKYVDKILGKLTDEQLKEYETIFDLYEKYNGSIKYCSQKLFVHKNTFQNKLIKFHNITGLDFRKLEDYTFIAIAFKLIKYTL